jgi:hypothetical protein
MEVEVTLAVICAEIWVFRWIVLRMPVVSAPPDWVAEEDSQSQPAAARGERRPGLAMEA